MVRRLPQTTSLTAVSIAVSSISQQTADSSASYLILGAATDGDAHEQVPTELSGQAVFDNMECCHGKSGCAKIYFVTEMRGTPNTVEMRANVESVKL